MAPGVPRLLVVLPEHWRINLSQREVWPLPSASGRSSLSPWNVLPDKTACLPVGLEPCQILYLTLWFMVRVGVGPCNISSTSSGTGDEGQPYRQSIMFTCLSPSKNSGHQGMGDWHTSLPWEVSAICTALAWRVTRCSAPKLSWTLFYVPLLGDFNLCLFTD